MPEPPLRQWASWARRYRLTPFKKPGATIRDHLNGILRHFDTGLSNDQIRAAKGYRTTDANLMIAISYLLCAKLGHRHRHPGLQAPAQA